MMFLTAYGALIFDAQVKADDFVIIPAASSSVGLAAIQLANYAGATPIALTRTSEKTSRLHEANAAHVIATQEQDMVAEVMRITNGNGARSLRSRRRPGLSQADLGAGRSGHRLYLRRIHPATLRHQDPPVLEQATGAKWKGQWPRPRLTAPTIATASIAPSSTATQSRSHRAFTLGSGPSETAETEPTQRDHRLWYIADKDQDGGQPDRSGHQTLQAGHRSRAAPSQSRLSHRRVCRSTYPEPDPGTGTSDLRLHRMNTNGAGRAAVRSSIYATRQVRLSFINQREG
jgi:hypothetical protein